MSESVNNAFEEVSKKYYFSNIFHLNCWENGKCKSSPAEQIRNLNPMEIFI
jgi:hypothetical protein